MIPGNIHGDLNIPLKRSKLIDETKLPIGPNVAATLDPKVLQQVYRYILDQYAMPQLMDRRPYEAIWKMLWDAYRMRLSIKDMRLNEDQMKLADNLLEKAEKRGIDEGTIADTIIFDTVDRMAGITNFVSWKDGSPVQFTKPRFQRTPLEDQFYNPTEERYDALNAVLQWNIQKNDVYLKSMIQARQHYLYGISFRLSDVYWKLQQNTESGELILKDVGISFEPISLRRVWINWRIPIWEMNKQPCPFYYTVDPDFAILQNTYDPDLNPFGYVNAEKSLDHHYSFWGTLGESEEVRALQDRLASSGQNLSTVQSGDTKRNQVRATWHFYPQLPLDIETGEFIKRTDGSPVPFKRFCWTHYGQDVLAVNITPLRLQEAPYFDKNPSLSGSTHLLDLDAGAYTMSICEMLLDYYVNTSTMMNQFIVNKDLINDPPSWMVAGSPAINNPKRNKPGANVEVLGENDFGWRQVPDATGTTVAMMDHLRDRAQTSSKAVDALMGKALGSRTSATEAQNVFQAAMSGVTTDINIFSYMAYGSYALSCYNLTYQFFDIDLIQAISGIFGVVMKKEEFNGMFSLKYDVGSTFIESIQRQEQLRWWLEFGTRSPVLDQTVLFKMLADETRMPQLRRAIMDNGKDRQIEKSKQQAVNTFLDRQVFIDPTQDHNTAIEVKMRFLEDQESAWMVEYKDLPYQWIPGMTRGMALAQQIDLHSKFAMLQMMQQQQVAMAGMQQEGQGGPNAQRSGMSNQGQMLSNAMQ